MSKEKDIDFTQKILFDEEDSIRFRMANSQFIPIQQEAGKQNDDILQQSMILEKPEYSDQDEEEQRKAIDTITDEEINQISHKLLEPLELKKETVLNVKTASLSYLEGAQIQFKHTQSCNEDKNYAKSPNQSPRKKKQLKKNIKKYIQDSNQNSEKTVSQYDFNTKGWKTVLSKLKKLEVSNQKIQSSLQHQTEKVTSHIMKSILELGLANFPVSKGINSAILSPIPQKNQEQQKKNTESSFLFVPQSSIEGKMSSRNNPQDELPEFEIPDYPSNWEQHQLKHLIKTLFQSFQHFVDYSAIQITKAAFDNIIAKNKKSNVVIEWYRNGNFYIGPFNSQTGKSGFGFEDVPGEYKYKGSFRNNKKEGKGTMRTIEGIEYRGQWKRNMRNGTGKEFENNRLKYQGQWSDDFYHGKGLLYLNNGDKYYGDFMKGVRHGYGQYVWRNGKIFKGEFKNGFKVTQVEDPLASMMKTTQLMKSSTKPEVRRKRSSFFHSKVNSHERKPSKSSSTPKDFLPVIHQNQLDLPILTKKPYISRKK